MGSFLGPLDDQIIIFLQSFSPLLDKLFAIITFFGDQLLVIGVIVLIYYIYDKDIALKAAYLSVITGFLTITLKGIFGLLRPYIIHSDIKGIPDILGTVPDDYTFPSGHSSTAGSFWSYISFEIKNKFVIIFAIAMVILVPLSRNYLGVHWPSDSIVGVLLGIILAYIVFSFRFTAKEKIDQANDLFLLILGIIGPIVALILAYAIIIAFNNDIKLADPSSMAGLLSGLSIGAYLDKKFVNFKVKEIRENKKILFYRAVIGLITILAIYFILKIIFSGGLFEEDLFMQMFRYLRYLLVALSGIFLIPVLFKTIEQKFGIY